MHTIKRLALVASLVPLFAALAAGQTSRMTVRDYFMSMPAKYFSLDCCITIKDPRTAKEKYLKTYLTIEDTANGYMTASGDAAQEGFEMALFKRPNGGYLIGFYTYGEGGIEDTPWIVFLDYSNGRWTDLSKREVPGYSPETLEYKLPRYGTTIEVHKKVEDGDAPLLYRLTWKNGKFVKTE